ncbi:UNVERIFIED_CONTAM: hypothetical protein NCL1_34571 [Trichonephila clavipes]
MMFSQEQIAIVEFYFAITSHCCEINAFQQKYPGETAPNSSTITLLVQQLHDTGSVAGRKRSSKALIMKTKVAGKIMATQFKSDASLFYETLPDSELCSTSEQHMDLLKLSNSQVTGTTPEDYNTSM